MASKYTPKHAAPGKHEAPRTTERPREQYKRPAAVPQEQSRRIPARSRRKRNKSKRIVRSVVLAALVVVFVLTTVMIVHSLRRDELKGAWALDDTTVYEFDGRGHGTLRLPLESDAFSYTIEDNFLTIDFADETATDAGYSYTRNGSALTLDTNTGVVYRLQKQK